MEIIGVKALVLFSLLFVFSVLAWAAAVLFERMLFPRMLSDRDYFWALTGPVLLSVITLTPEAFTSCGRGFDLPAARPLTGAAVFLFVAEMLLLCTAAMAVVNTIRYGLYTMKENRAMIKVRMNPSEKLRVALENLKSGDPSPPPFYEISIPGSMPCTLGWLHPWCLVPSRLVNALSPRELEAVLWHEIGHARRFDNLKKMTGFFSASLMIFFPWAKSLFKRWEEAAELRCDRFSVRLTGRPLDTASALISSIVGSGLGSCHPGRLGTEGTDAFVLRRHGRHRRSAAASVRPGKNPTPLFISGFGKENSGIGRVKAILWQWENGTSCVFHAGFFRWGALLSTLWMTVASRFHLVAALACLFDLCRR